MANGIKLRRGLKASLTPPVEGELTYATDTKELGLPDGSYIKLADLEELLTPSYFIKASASFTTKTQLYCTLLD